MGDREAYENNGVDVDNKRGERTIGKVAGTLMFMGFRSSTR